MPGGMFKLLYCVCLGGASVMFIFVLFVFLLFALGTFLWMIILALNQQSDLLEHAEYSFLVVFFQPIYVVNLYLFYTGWTVTVQPGHIV